MGDAGGCGHIMWTGAANVVGGRGRNGGGVRQGEAGKCGREQGNIKERLILQSTYNSFIIFTGMHLTMFLGFVITLFLRKLKPVLQKIKNVLEC